ncbi:MAG: acyltransferase [Gemmatimonadota bacterium]|nr:acyltransferase [Gemmatimonadota bacterium]
MAEWAFGNDPAHRGNRLASARAVLRRARREPGRALAVARALIKGHLYRLYYRVRGSRFRAGRNLRVYGSLSIRGPGEVVFGDNVVVYGRPTPWTYARQARIVVGDNVILGRAEFGCAREIVIGRDCIIGRCYIMDTDFHSTRADRWSPDAPVRVASVHIGANVWVGQNAAILPGVRIGENSVVSFGAVCAREYPPNVIIAGNPARVAGQIQAAGETPDGGDGS